VVGRRSLWSFQKDRRTDRFHQDRATRRQLSRASLQPGDRGGISAVKFSSNILSQRKKGIWALSAFWPSCFIKEGTKGREGGSASDLEAGCGREGVREDALGHLGGQVWSTERASGGRLAPRDEEK
jgi:hypothetical protein